MAQVLVNFKLYREGIPKEIGCNDVWVPCSSSIGQLKNAIISSCPRILADVDAVEIKVYRTDESGTARDQILFGTVANLNLDPNSFLIVVVPALPGIYFCQLN